MGAYVRRVQTVLTEDAFYELSRLSEETQKPLSVLVREAIEKVYLKQAVLSQRQRALHSLLSLKAPVSDWPEMEEEIIRGAMEE
mgnify:CR=1 FL=1